MQYQIDIQTPKRKQTFITEDLEDDQARKTRLKSFIDVASSLTDYTIDIRSLSASEAKTVVNTSQPKLVECLHEQGRFCPLGDDQSLDACLHCEGRGL